MQIRVLSSLGELTACEEIEREVWGLPDRELLPASHMVAILHAGGLAAGAFDGDTLVGFVFAFLAHRPHEPQAPFGLHSHLMAVRAPYRGAGLGRALKWFQRDWCLARGLPWVTWTFDPLQVGNARLNLEHLGATAIAYRRDEYGPLGGVLGVGLPSDRFLALWNLAGERAARRAAAEGLPSPDLAGLPRALRAGPDGRPETAADLSAPRFLAEVPARFTALMAEDPERALAWRLASRRVFEAALAAGYRATRFVGQSYLLERTPETQEERFTPPTKRM